MKTKCDKFGELILLPIAFNGTGRIHGLWAYYSIGQLHDDVAKYHISKREIFAWINHIQYWGADVGQSLCG